MRTVVDRRAHVQLTTEVVAPQDAFAYWREMICATFVRLAAEPIHGAGAFRGRIEHIPVGAVELSTVVAGSQQVTRTPRLISQEAADDFLLASIQLSGRGLVEQDGRIAALDVGEMAFYDSTRPYRLRFEDPFHQLVVQVAEARPDGARDPRADRADSRNLDSMLVRIERSAIATVDDARRAGRHVGELVKRTIGVTVGVEVVEPDTIERSLGKMRRMVDERPAE